MTAPDATRAVEDLRAALGEAEAALAAAVRARQARPDAPVDVARLVAACRAVDEAAAACGRVPVSLARRAAAVRTHAVLQARAAPGDDLDGLYEAVRAGTDAGSWRRAGMSHAFLDAPRALARWRGAALAAAVLLGLGLGALAFGPARVSLDPEPEPQALHDPRAEFLTPYVAASAADAPTSTDGRLQPTGMGGATTDAVPAGAPLPSGAPGARRGYVSFHVSGSFRADGSLRIDEGALLDAAGARLHVAPAPAERALRESN